MTEYQNHFAKGSGTTEGGVFVPETICVNRFDSSDKVSSAFFLGDDIVGHFQFLFYEGTSFSGRKFSKHNHLSELMLSCLLTDFDCSSVSVKLTHECNISSDMHLVVFQARTMQP